MKSLNMIVVYGKNSGVATTATYFGNQWWITSKDERLEPLYSKGSLILMKDIAGMMGCAMECGEIDTREVLKNRLRDLNALGVKFQAVPQVMNLVLHVRTKVDGYSVSCDDGDNDWMRFFELDGFDSAKLAWEKVRIFMDFFMKHGVKVQARLQCRAEVVDELAGLTQGVKIEIKD